MYYTYMLRCKDNSIYTGIAVDLKRRINEHLNQTKKCAKYTLSHPAIKLEIAWKSENKVLASRLEFYIKKLSKQEKEMIIVDNNKFKTLLSSKIDVESYKVININEI